MNMFVADFSAWSVLTCGCWCWFMYDCGGETAAWPGRGGGTGGTARRPGDTWFWPVKDYTTAISNATTMLK